ncbi:hypothetical protein B4084_0506 [Bacillus cereus]|nr:hypothetical protein B4084_0506 [Bacillus cereus]
MLMLFFHLTLRKTFYNLDNGGLIEYVIGSLTHFVLLLMHSFLKLVVVSTKINRLALHLVIDLTYLLVYGLRIPHPNYHFFVSSHGFFALKMIKLDLLLSLLVHDLLNISLTLFHNHQHPLNQIQQLSQHSHMSLLLIKTSKMQMVYYQIVFLLIFLANN